MSYFHDEHIPLVQRLKVTLEENIVAAASHAFQAVAFVNTEMSVCGRSSSGDVGADSLQTESLGVVVYGLFVTALQMSQSIILVLDKCEKYEYH